ncbi:hypothetical protein JAAARDRAFT_66906 [Jaapia argillacea MUCL 33604]|uniref:Uncharacterized protein n=1 Tax=Jaapia argillacea MUCL 33604 TaxID=933084 RepID=A0A067Q4A1_9AGAM|nr:hypothetical protein JAAARDRAFT_66906 [Jaapia argillacea MUCL 33604]
MSVAWSPMAVEVPIPESMGFHISESYLAFSEERKPLLVFTMNENRHSTSRSFHFVVIYAVHTSPPSFERLSHIHLDVHHRIWAPSVGGNLLAYLVNKSDACSDDPWTLHIRTIGAGSVRQVAVQVKVQYAYPGPGIVVLSEERLILHDDTGIFLVHIPDLRTVSDDLVKDFPTVSFTMDQIHAFSPTGKCTGAINHTLWSGGGNRGHCLPVLFRGFFGGWSEINHILHILDNLSPGRLPRHSTVTLPERGRYCALGTGFLRSISTDDWGPLQEAGDDAIPLMAFFPERGACEQWIADGFKTGLLVVPDAAQMYLRAFDEVSGRICLGGDGRLLVIDVKPPGQARSGIPLLESGV